MKKLGVAAIVAVCSLPLAAQAQDWTGLYGGLNYGISNSGSGLAGSNDKTYGGFVGYNFDLGGGVAGVELGYSDPNKTLSGGGELKDQFELKGRYGFGLGDQGLLYGTVGYLQADVSTGGTAKGYLVGVGYDHMLTDNVFIGGELTHNRYDDLPVAGKASSNNLDLRIGFKF